MTILHKVNSAHYCSGSDKNHETDGIMKAETYQCCGNLTDLPEMFVPINELHGVRRHNTLSSQ